MAPKSRNVEGGAGSKRLGREMLSGVARLFSNNLASKWWNNMGKSGSNAKMKLDTSAMSLSMRVATLDGGCLITDDEMENLAECYPLTYSVAYMCRICSVFQEPFDDDEGTADEGMDEEDDDDDDDANALMVFDGASDVADGRDDYDEARMSISNSVLRFIRVH
uniref:Uncharacterized protein n=1 Tax=Solanum tuberosum TaxID=4113 RepID=M1DAB9_SOLTU